MKTLCILILSLILTGCMETPDQRFDRFMTELDCPVILIAKNDKAEKRSAVVIRDNSGRVRTFETYYGLPQAVSHSRVIGDTLKPCNP